MSRGIGRMATVYKHLSVEELEERYVGSQDATTSRHFQVIWLLIHQLHTQQSEGRRPAVPKNHDIDVHHSFRLRRG